MNSSQSHDRRLPVYLLIDASAVMGGEPLESISEALSGLKQRLMTKPETLENSEVSLIVFNSVANQYPFVPIEDFVPPTLFASGSRALGAALHALVESLAQDIHPRSADYRGDQRPLAILILGGAPTDSFEEDVSALAALPTWRRPGFILLACGDPEALPAEFLRPLTPVRISIRQVTAEALARAFHAVEGTIIQTSRRVAQGNLESLSIVDESLLSSEGSDVIAALNQYAQPSQPRVATSQQVESE